MSKQTEDYINSGLEWLAVVAGIGAAVIDYFGGIINIAGGFF